MAGSGNAPDARISKIGEHNIASRSYGDAIGRMDACPGSRTTVTAKARKSFSGDGLDAAACVNTPDAMIIGIGDVNEAGGVCCHPLKKTD
ncbi:MAG: hypothetical protein ACK5TN_15735 [Acidobacteriota bacterium]